MPATNKSTVTTRIGKSMTSEAFLETASSWLNAIFVVVTLAAALIGVGAWYFSAKLSTAKDAALGLFRAESAERTKALELEIAQQRERAAKAEKDLLELQQRLAWRKLTPDQVTKLTISLEGLKGSRVDIHLLGGGVPEVEQYGEQLRNVFEAAGISVDSSPVSLIGDAGRHGEGLSAYFGANRESDVLILEGALRGSGTISEALPRRPYGKGREGELSLLVWPK
jgi:hypothetical protein